MARKKARPGPAVSERAGAWRGELGRGDDTYRGLDLGPCLGLSVRAMVKSQLQGADAGVAATEIAVNAAMAVAECQWTLLHETWNAVFSSSRALLAAGGSPAAAEEEVECVRRVGEKFVADGKELAGWVAKANTELCEAWRARLAEMVEDAERLLQDPDEQPTAPKG